MMTKSGLERRKVVISGCEYRLKLYNSESSIQLFFLQKVVRQKDTHVTSFCMHFEKVGRGLQREAFRRQGECIVSQKRGGNNCKKTIVYYSEIWHIQTLKELSLKDVNPIYCALPVRAWDSHKINHLNIIFRQLVGMSQQALISFLNNVMLIWLDKLNPTLISETQSVFFSQKVGGILWPLLIIIQAGNVWTEYTISLIQI